MQKKIETILFVNEMFQVEILKCSNINWAF